MCLTEKGQIIFQSSECSVTEDCSVQHRNSVINNHFWSGLNLHCNRQRCESDSGLFENIPWDKKYFKKLPSFYNNNNPLYIQRCEGVHSWCIERSEYISLREEFQFCEKDEDCHLAIQIFNLNETLKKDFMCINGYVL